MDKNLFENDIKSIISYNNEVLSSLKNMYSGLDSDNEYREILDEFLDYVWLEINKETRLGAYFRIVDLHENSLELYMDANNFEKSKKDDVLNKSYEYVSDFYIDIHNSLLSFVKDNNLLTEFYREIVEWTITVWIAFNNFFPVWRNHIIFWINRELENLFNNDWEKIINYLNENNLFDKWHWWDLADRSYSVLVKDLDWNYSSKSYFDAFKFEVNTIVKSLDKFIKNISKLEDEIYNSKEEYINYLNSIKNALLERDVDNLVYKWSLVDEAWMSIKTPLQISHPLEFYEDKYRKAVAPEWDLRILNNVFDSVVESDIENMYENIFSEIWIDNFKKSYEFSKANFKRVQLYLTTPILYFSAELTWLFSAQVVPNDEIISDKFWKKIFAFPEMVLSNKRSKPFMKLQNIIFDENLLDNYRKYLFWEDSLFYKVYDIETIGHEFGHTLWLDIDSESIMNSKTGVFKNIEEFKATTWWLVAYFMWKNKDDLLSESVIRDHVIRTIWLLSYKKVNEIEPYYCEALIHLSILNESWIISLDNNKVSLNFSNYENLKEIYINHYKKLINVYLNKVDANEFLKDYAFRENWYFMPLDKKLYNFVDYYYTNYNKYWNEVDSETKKEKYIK